MAVRIDNPVRSAGVATACMVCALGMLVLSFQLAPREGDIDDFVQEWTSARNHLHGRAVYEDLHLSVEREFGPELADILPNQYNGHPPVGILAAVPLGSLPYRTAHLVWNVLSLTALAIALWLILGRVGLGLPASAWAFVGAVLLWSTPLARQVVAGQPNLILLMLIAAGWAAMRHRRDGLAGVFLGTAAAFKLFPAFLFLYPLLQRRWRVIVAGGAAFLALNVVAASVLGPNVFFDFVTLVLPDLRKSQDWWLNFSLTGFSRKLFYVTSGHSVALWQNRIVCYTLIGVGTLAVIAAAAWKVRFAARQTALAAEADGRPDAELPQDVAFATCMLANLLVSPITWDHYFVLLLLPILIFWKSTTSIGQRAFLLTCSLLLAINVQWIWNPMIVGEHELAYLWGGAQSVATPLQAITLLSYPFYTMLALFVFGLTRSGRAVETSSSGAARHPHSHNNGKTVRKSRNASFQRPERSDNRQPPQRQPNSVASPSQAQTSE